MKTKSLSILLILLPFFLFSQDKKKDSLSIHHLKDVVVTAQIKPQSIKKAIHNVRVISQSEIKKLAATNLSDVLNQYLNITITPSSGTGRSTVSMFGLDGNYFKILVDNIPIVSEGSMGSNIDLTQINLDDVAQIEIIEGSMGVTHGANAVSGILNIITKKSIQKTWEVTATVQEETVGQEYALSSKGRHIQAVKVSHNINSKWFASVGFNRNHFAGYFDDKKGASYTESDGLRGYTWLPKLNTFSNGLVSYTSNKMKAFYRFDYLNEQIDYYNASLISIANPPFGNNLFANDKRYLTQRFYHHLNLIGNVSNIKYDLSFSHQKQTRKTENFTYNFQTDQEENLSRTANQSAEVLYSTGTFSNFFTHDKIDLQLGYEFVNNQGIALVDGPNQSLVRIDKRFENYDFFIASEIKATDKFLLRGGYRVSLQNRFDHQSAASFGLRYLFENGIELRSSVGKSFRVPTFEELYSKIQFSGHNFFGNENLIPERSTSVDLNVKKVTFHDTFKLSNQISAAYLNVGHRIDMAYVGLDANAAPIYQYINVNAYQMWNVAMNHQLEYNQWKASLGLIYVGIAQKMDNGQAVSDDSFLYNLQFNTSLSYEIPKWNANVSLFYKFNGKQPQFVSSNENGKPTYLLSEIDSYSFLDCSFRKQLFQKKLDLTIGARNLLDVKRIGQSLVSGGHSSSALLMGYGRSYFIKLSYNLNFK